MDILMWVMLGILVIMLFMVLLIHDGVKYIWRKLEKMDSSISAIEHSVTTTQGQLRTRIRSGETRAQMDPRPKVEQPYAGQGVQRTAPGTEEGTTSGESPAVRAVKIARVRIGGKDGEDPNSRL